MPYTIQGETVRQSVRLPWKAWYEDGALDLSVPSDWRVDVLAPASSPQWSTERIRDALETPIEAERLSEIARTGRTACVAVDDFARPTRVADVLPGVLAQLEKGGIPRSRVTIVMATGTHRAPERKLLSWKVGDQVAGYCDVVIHDANRGLAGTGIEYGSRELRINRRFLEADIKVAIGAALPHSFAGYGGGAKLMLPGLADVEATTRSHKFVLMGLRGGKDPRENQFRMEIERLARQIGLQYCVSVVPNFQRETAGVFAGDIVAAHRKACNAAAHSYATSVGEDYDCCILNAYPKDIDLVQAPSAFIALRGLTRPLLREDGIFVLTTAATEGLGHHGLFAPGGASYRTPAKIRPAGHHAVWVFAPGISQEEAHQVFWSGYRFFGHTSALTQALEERFHAPARLAVVPFAPMQQLLS